jgi:hypothetical protein
MARSSTTVTRNTVRSRARSSTQTIVLIVGVAVAGDVDLVVAIEEPMAGLVIDGQLAAGRATTWAV